MIDESEINAYLRSVVLKFSGLPQHIVLMKFLCECLELIREYFPPVGRAAFDTAKAYWFRNEGNGDNLEAARVSCWEFLNQKHRSFEIIDNEDVALRALLSALHCEPDTEDFSTDSVRWCVDMMNRLGDYSMEVRRLIQI